MHSYPRHLGDYAKDTGHLSVLEHGCYTLLTDWYYANERAIPADKVYRIAKASNKDEKAAADTVLADFFALIDGLWTQKRIDAEIAKCREKSVKAASSAHKRWQCDGNANASETHSICTPERNANQEPITNNHKPSKKAGAFTHPSLDELVSEFTGRTADPSAEANKFLNYYESNGWKVGKNPMKSWKATVSMWISRNHDNAPPVKTSMQDRLVDRSWANETITDQNYIDHERAQA